MRIDCAEMHDINKHTEDGRTVAMAQSKSAFWGGFVMLSGAVLLIREGLVLMRGVGQQKVFAVISGVLELPIPQIDTILGWTLNYVGALAVAAMTYGIAKYTMDKKDAVLGFAGFAIGFGLLAAGLAGSAWFPWLLVSLATGMATAYASEKARAFPASEVFSLEMGAIIGMTASVALEYGLFMAAVVEFWGVYLYWLGASAVVMHFLGKKNRYDEEDSW